MVGGLNYKFIGMWKRKRLLKNIVDLLSGCVCVFTNVWFDEGCYNIVIVFVCFM